MRSLAVVVLLASSGCLDSREERAGGSPGELGSVTSTLTTAQRRERVTAIRDVAAGVGLMNGALLAGIAQSETNMAHCWSEATWACKGPASPSCAGGPVIAGSGDGACALEQGGLGMFQFDGGTYAQTLARHGDDILTLEGNIDEAVDFVVQRSIEEIPGVGDRGSALGWLNLIPMEAGDPLMEEWAAMIVCRYNGCCSSSELCRARRVAYRDNAINLYREYGAEFWGAAQGCEPVPADGRVIDETDLCFVAGGEARYWRRAATGHMGGLDWTKTTARATAANVGTWRIDIATAGRYAVEVFLDGGVVGQSRKARYQVRHGGEVTEIVVDQRRGKGFYKLGVFDFAAGGDQSVVLGDNTGEGGDGSMQLAYDAIRVRPLGKGDELGGGDSALGCASGGPAAGGLGLSFVAVLLARRRRR